MDIIERIQEIINYEGLNVSSFAKKIGVVDQSIRGIVVQRRNKPGYEIISKIIQTFDWINAEWLITGKGEMIKSVSNNQTAPMPSLAELVQYLREKDSKIEQLIEEKTELKIRFDFATKQAAYQQQQSAPTGTERPTGDKVKDSTEMDKEERRYIRPQSYSSR